MKQSFDVVIIGGGIAGMTAAIYLKRANLNTMIIERSAFGGQMNSTSIIENYPGIESISGPDFSLNLYNQVKNLKTEIKYDEVMDLKKDKNKFLITTKNEEIVASKIIVATGRVPRRLGLLNEEKLTGKGISLCAVCDGFFYKNKTVAIIGSGNSSLEESLYLAELAKEVYIINRSKTFKGDKTLEEKVLKTKNIKVIYEEEVIKLIEKENKLDSLLLSNNETLKVDGLFIYIGFEPKFPFLKNLKLETKNGYLKVDKNMETNIDGIYACGDSIFKDFYQISTAASEGTIAALNIKKKLN